MAFSHSPHIVTDSLKLLIDPKDEICNGGKSVLTDLSGNSISGSLYTGNGLRFDGVDDWAPIADSSLWDFGTGNFSISCWVRLDTNPLTSDGLVGAIEGGDGSNNGWTLHLQLDSSDISGRFYYLSGGTGLHVTTSPIFTADSKFHHVVAVRDGDSITVYADGVAGTATTGVASTSINSTSNNEGITLGSLYAPSEADNNADNNLLNGSLSDVRIYHGALSSADVSVLYNKPNTVLPGNVSGSQLKGWWPLTERNGTTAYDGSGNGNHSSFNSTPMWVSSSADIPQLGSKGFSKKMVFDGTNDYVNTGNNFQSTFRDSFSIGCWFKADDGQPSEERQFGGEVTSGDEIQLALQHSSQVGKLYFGYYSDGDTAYGRTSSAVLSDGPTDWHHVVFVANNTTNQMSIYFDGAAQSLTSGDLSGVTMGDFTTSNNFYIGALNNAGSLVYEWAGLLDEYVIYNTALSAGAVQELAASSSYGLPTPKDARNVSGSNLVAYYRNNGNGEETWNDLSGNSATKITPTGSPTEIYFPESHIKGRDSQGMFLTNPNEGWYDVENNNTYDTAGAYINLGSDAIVAAGPLTVCLWVYWPIRSGGPLITFKTGGNGFILHGEDQGKIFMGFHGEHKMNTAGDPATISTWNHIAAVYDGNDDDLVGSYKIYVNGISYSLSRTGSTLNGTVAVNMIGNDTGTTSWNVNPFEKGRITAVSVYEKELSAAEVLQNYNAQLRRFESISEDYWQ